MRFQNDAFALTSLKDHYMQQKSHTGRNGFIRKMLSVVLKEISCFTKSVCPSMIGIKRNHWKGFAWLQPIHISEHTCHFDYQSLGFLADEVVLRRVRTLAFGNEPKGKANPGSLVFGSWWRVHDEPREAVWAESYLHRLVRPHSGGRKQIYR